MNIMLKETSESVGLLRRKRIKTSSIHKIPNKVLKQLIQKENLREESISSIENNVSLPQKEESLDLIGNITYLLNTKEEKIILLSNDVSFTLYGKGNFKIYFGCLKILGSEFYSFDETNTTYQFDFSEEYPLFPMETNKDIKKYDLGRFEILIETETKLRNLAKNNNELSNLKEGHFYTLIYFFNLSDSFTFVDKLNNSYEILKENNFITNKYGQYMDYSSLIDKSNTFLITGKKNSGKSVFSTFLLNKMFLSHLKSDRELYFVDCDAGQPLLTEPFCVSLIKINQPILTNYPNKSLTINKVILKNFVEENNQINYWQNYLFLLNSLVGYFRLNLNYNKRNYLVINTNGYIDSLGFTINSKLSELIKPNIIFFLKNQFSGRGEKSRRLETFYFEKFSRNVIFLQNNFNLDDKKTTYLKNLNRLLCLYSNLLSNFSLNNNYYIKNKLTPPFLDVIHNKDFYKENTVEIEFENLNFCFDSFVPKSELEILYAINLKLCVFLDLDKFSQNSKLNNGSVSFSDLKVIDKNFLVEKNFIAFGFILNIDIINKKIIILSHALKEFLKLSSAEKKKLVIFRNTQIDSCIGSIRRDYENLFEKLVDNVSFYNDNDDNSHSNYQISYYLRNIINK